ncbi:hypothetical protein PsYK624_031700 [Phanerochaete sordida]|uniref:Uncharacterized protein n=1 Tax=Phanerochaete sordida TaxID=48140 RepID=A0A9P3LAS3_9APHY|nr:hypothetical protein PsYK624_031700 [Phanerochaete sordida]
MPIYYYQVAGWKSHVTRPHGKYIPRPTEEVAHILWDYLAEDGLLTLTLGIAPCGASYLLVAATPDLNAELRRLFQGSAWPATRFVALSPVEFRTADALHAKLNRHQQKSKGRKGRRNDEDRDLSQANTHYTTGRPFDVVSQDGRDRALFEHHRVFYRLCRASVDSAEYSVQRVPFFDNIRALSFACTIHEPSRWRNDEERRTSPVILDLGLTEWILPASSMDMTAERDEYYTVQPRALLQNPGRTRGKYMYGEPQPVTDDVLREKLAQTFARRLDAPMLLFMHNADDALDVLRFYGVDTSDWTTHFEPVVGRDVLAVSARHPLKNTKDEPDVRGRYDSQHRARSDRSRSPTRGAHAPRARSPPPQTSRHPVYVVDIAALSATMRRTPAPPHAPVQQLADALGVALDPPFPAGQWCAGNESRLVALIWCALAAGNAIDEQYLEMQAQMNRPIPAPEVQAPLAAAAPPGKWDDDVDPNDVVAAQPPPGQRPNNPYDDFESEDFEEW